MSNFIKDCIYITKIQKQYLKKESAKLGIKFSELLRRILDEYIKKQEDGE